MLKNNGTEKSQPYNLLRGDLVQDQQHSGSSRVRGDWCLHRFVCRFSHTAPVSSTTLQSHLQLSDSTSSENGPLVVCQGGEGSCPAGRAVAQSVYKLSQCCFQEITWYLSVLEFCSKNWLAVFRQTLPHRVANFIFLWWELVRCPLFVSWKYAVRYH